MLNMERAMSIGTMKLKSSDKLCGSIWVASLVLGQQTFS